MRVRGRDREAEINSLLGATCMMHRYLTANTTMLIFSCRNAQKNDFSDKPKVGDHAEGLESEEENTGKRQRLREGEKEFSWRCDIRGEKHNT